MAEALDVALCTVYLVKQRFAKEELAGVLKDRPQANQRRKLDAQVVELKLASSMSHEGVRKRLKKTLSSPGRRRNGAFPR